MVIYCRVYFPPFFIGFRFLFDFYFGFLFLGLGLGLGSFEIFSQSIRQENGGSGDRPAI